MIDDFDDFYADFLARWPNTPERERKREATAELAAYWREIGDFDFHEATTIMLVVYMCRQYEAALCRIAKESPEGRQVALDSLGSKWIERFERIQTRRGRETKTKRQRLGL